MWDSQVPAFQTALSWQRFRGAVVRSSAEADRASFGLKQLRSAAEAVSAVELAARCSPSTGRMNRIVSGGAL